jgi:hypothetical protein
METVIFKNNLNSHVIEQGIQSDLMAKINAIPNITQLKLDLELTLYCANVVENLVKKKNKINKKQLVINVLCNVFQLTMDEQILLGGQLDFLNSNKKIKALSTLKYIARSILSWIQKKIL